MDLSVFIINYNTGDLLEKCLNSIYRGRNHIRLEIFVGDNCSQDNSADIVGERFPSVLLKKYESNLGVTKAMNDLLPLASGEFCLIIHPDLELLPGTIHDLIMFLKKNPKIGIVGGDLYYPDGTPNPCEIGYPGFLVYLQSLLVRLLKKIFGTKNWSGKPASMYWNHAQTSRVHWVWNACMMVRKEVFEKIGYFDEQFYVWFADWDFCKRAFEKGWESYYLCGAKAIHHERQSFGKEDAKDVVRYKIDGWRSMAAMTKDRYRFIRKYVDTGNLLGIKSVDIMENVGRLAMIVFQKTLGRISMEDAMFSVKTCLRTIQTILFA